MPGQVHDSRHVVPDSYPVLDTTFRWHVPVSFNIAQVCVRRWAEDPEQAQQPATIEDGPGLTRQRCHTFADLAAESNRLSHALRLLGVRRGERVPIVLPQRFETAVAYLAVLQLGAVAVPLSQLFGPQALEYRLQDSAAVLALVDDTTGPGVMVVCPRCPALRHVVGLTRAFDPEAIDWPHARDGQRADFALVETAADDPAILIYTSGTTGNPKGALIPHRALIGNLIGFARSQNWFGFDPADPRQRSQAIFRSPADWAWTGGANGRAAADAVLWAVHRRVAWAFGSGAGVCSARAPSLHTHLFVPDRAQGDHESRTRAPAPPPLAPADHHERGRAGGGCDVRLLPRAVRRNCQRDVRSDRESMTWSATAHACGRPARVARAVPSRDTASPCCASVSWNGPRQSLDGRCLRSAVVF